MTKTLFQQHSVITLILSIYPATTYPQDFYKWSMRVAQLITQSHRRPPMQKN